RLRGRCRSPTDSSRRRPDALPARSDALERGPSRPPAARHPADPTSPDDPSLAGAAARRGARAPLLVPLRVPGEPVLPVLHAIVVGVLRERARLAAVQPAVVVTVLRSIRELVAIGVALPRLRLGPRVA